jgi:hypothetical protein
MKCYDSEPDKIIAREMRRDAQVDDDDFVEIILDTYHDHRSGFYFITNPHGSRRDAKLANEGRNYNSSWDGIWECKTQINDKGWFVEIAIPWKTLRFAEQDSSIWGVNVGRMIRRKNEHVFWQLIPRDLGYGGLFRLSEAGNLHGLSDLKMGGNLELKPYFMGGLERDEVTAFATDRLTDVGLDVKVSVTANLALDLTANPDFAQVEADREQVNLSRFSLYYPEKREFFLEGAEVFSFGSSGHRRFGGSDLELFYSRRIGLVSGQRARILGGMKLVGKIGEYHIGVMNMVTDQVTIEDEDELETIGSSNFSVIRFRRDILKRGSIGLMLLNKENLSNKNYNRTLGFDGYFPLNNYFTISGYLAATSDPEIGMTGQWLNIDKNVAGNLNFNYNSDRWRASLSYTDIGANFNPEMGFIRRLDYRLVNTSLTYSPRPQNASFIRQFSYGLSGRYREDHNNIMLDNEVQGSFGIRFQSSARLYVNVERSVEFIDEDWEVREGYVVPKGSYPGMDYSLRFTTDQSRRLAGGLRLNYGDYYTGRSLRVGVGSSITNIPRLRMDIDYNHNYVEMSEGSFHTNTVGLRAFYFFSTELYLKTYIQLNDDRLRYEDREKVVSNVLLRWIYSPGSNLYLVYNDSRLIGPGHDEIKNRTVILKTTFFWRQ